MFVCIIFHKANDGIHLFGGCCDLEFQSFLQCFSEMETAQEQTARFDKLIAEVEDEIVEWRKRNSQSDPGAVAELRDLRTRLAALKKAREQALAHAA